MVGEGKKRGRVQRSGRAGPLSAKDIMKSMAPTPRAEVTTNALTVVPDIASVRTIRTHAKGPPVLVNNVATYGPSTIEEFENDRASGPADGGGIGGAYSVTWKAPRTLSQTETDGATTHFFDPRGQLQVVRKIKASFMNTSNDYIIVHASTPMTDASGSESVVTRAFGFKKGKTEVSAVTIAPKKKAFFTVNQSKFIGGLRLIEQVVKKEDEANPGLSRGVHINVCQFAVVRPNVSAVTGSGTTDVSGSAVSVVCSVEYDRIPIDQLFSGEAVTNDIQVENTGKEFAYASLDHVNDLYGFTEVDVTETLKSLEERISALGVNVTSRLVETSDGVVAKVMYEHEGEWIPLFLDVPSWVRLSIPGLGMGIGGRYSACIYAEVDGQLVLYDEESGKPHYFPRVIDGGSVMMLTAGAVQLSYDERQVPGLFKINWGKLLAKVFSRLVDVAIEML